MGLLKELATKPDSMKSQVEEKLGEEVLAVGELRGGRGGSPASSSGDVDARRKLPATGSAKPGSTLVI